MGQPQYLQEKHWSLLLDLHWIVAFVESSSFKSLMALKTPVIPLKAAFLMFSQQFGNCKEVQISQLSNWDVASAFFLSAYFKAL